MGKTAFAMSIAEFIALRRNRYVFVCSMEMPKKSLYVRMLSSLAEVDSQVIRSARYSAEDYEAIKDAKRILDSDYMHICDQPAMKPSQIMTEIRKVQRKGEISLIVIDYLGLADPERETNNRTQDVTALIKAFKNIARKVKVPTIVLSQLNRRVEGRENKRPMLSDLNESGGVEAEADIVVGLYRESYYKRMAMAENERPVAPTEDETEVLLLKHRNGEADMFKVGFVPRFTKFTTWDAADSRGSTGY